MDWGRIKFYACTIRKLTGRTNRSTSMTRHVKRRVEKASEGATDISGKRLTGTDDSLIIMEHQ